MNRIISSVRPFLRHLWLAIPIAILVFILPTWWLRIWVPKQGVLPTPTPAPTSIPLDDVFTQALQLAATDPLDALPLLSDVAFSDNPHAKAAHTVWQAIQGARLANDAGYTLTASGRALAAIGEWGLARQALVKAVELDPDYVEAWAYLGEAQQQNGEDGLPALLRAEELDPRSISAHLFTALYWQRQNDYEKADQEFRHAASEAPDDPQIQIQWGQNSVLAGDSPKALAHFLKALDLAPEQPEIWKALASYSVENELYVSELGLGSAQRYLLAKPKDAQALVLNARAHALLGHVETARSFFTRAIDIAPNLAEAHLYFGIFLLANGEPEAARTELNQALLLAPDTPQAELAAYWLGQITH